MDDILINYNISYFMKILTVALQGSKIKLFKWFAKPLIVISFQTHPVTVRFEYDLRFGNHY